MLRYSGRLATANDHRSPTAVGTGHWQRIWRPVNMVRRQRTAGAAVRVERLVSLFALFGLPTSAEFLWGLVSCQ